MDLTLDEIIKMKKIGGSSYPQNRRLPKNSNNRTPNSEGRVYGRVKKSPQQAPRSRVASDSGGKPFDLRRKIIQKNRQRLTDPRDKLAEIARQKHARTKIRERKTEYAPRREPCMDTYDQPKFRTLEPSSLPRNTEPRRMSLEMRARLDMPPRRHRPLSPSPPPAQPQGHRIVVSNLHFNVTHEDIKELFEAIGPLLTSHLVRAGTAEVIYKFQKDAKKAVDAYHNRQFDGRPMKCLLVNSNSRPTTSSSSSLPRNTEPRRMSLEMRARLDMPPRRHRPLSPSPPPAQPQGHRIVVSNLHFNVTHEDIKELFEDIGPLLTSHLVRAGTAEVVYKFQKDAKKAVDAYHNRQFDGQPMKCELVNSNSRPTTSSSSSGVLRSDNMPATPKFPNSSKSMVVPDQLAIHKALFTSK